MFFQNSNAVDKFIKEYRKHNFDENLINYYATKFGILPSRARKIYFEKCVGDQSEDFEHAIRRYKEKRKEFQLCNLKESNSSILKQCFEDNSGIYKDPELLIGLCSFFSDKKI